ncbi:MAG: hypothetical protein MUC56_14185 [Thermoanaerobaculales bacterium]|jgi:hypothetical protein|nr:hypothetical protein [Thermoanaerobaculales bacterium]
MKHTVLISTIVLQACLVSAQQLLVFPAVTDEEPGVNGSVWVTTATVVKVDPLAEITIRRKWVCLRDGGFVDDPATAPSWTLPAEEPKRRLMFEPGGELLEGTGATIGAAAFEVEGGEVIAHSNAMDVRWGEYSPGPVTTVFGQGQHIVPFREPLEGPSHIPWLGGCNGARCSDTTQGPWQNLRNNIGVVNPNPEPLTVLFSILPFGFNDPDPGAPNLVEWGSPPLPEFFVKTVPAYGWRQFHWESAEIYSTPWGSFYPTAGFIISLTPQQQLPYYAYASVIFTPDPDLGVPEFNDPMFIPAEPGYVMPWFEASPDP